MHLGVERELFELHPLDEHGFDSASLVHHGATVHVVRHGTPRALLGRAQDVVHVQLGVPVLAPVYPIHLLGEHMELTAHPVKHAFYTRNVRSKDCHHGGSRILFPQTDRNKSLSLSDIDKALT